jgi:hypothetical protein
MKDARGHGSDPRGAHSAGVQSVGQPVKVHPGVLAMARNNPGGFSVHPFTGKAPEGGFMVAHPGRTQFVDSKTLAGPQGRQLLNDFATRNSDLLTPGSANHIGGWTDSETGKTHLDVAENIHGEEHAVPAGRARNQIAIWDVKNQREIRTGGMGDLT